MPQRHDDDETIYDKKHTLGGGEVSFDAPPSVRLQGETTLKHLPVTSGESKVVFNLNGYGVGRC